jgi:Fic family protein
MTLRSAQSKLRWSGERSSFGPRSFLVCNGRRLPGLAHTQGTIVQAALQLKAASMSPVGAHMVRELVEDMCDYINDHWNESTPIHLASYLMWRLNWIHPFADGNGRTSRIVSYVVLSIRAGSILPGTPTIPDQIVDNRKPYFDALDAADLAFRDGKIDVSKMEELLGSLLANQLAQFYKSVGGKLSS